MQQTKTLTRRMKMITTIMSLAVLASVTVAEPIRVVNRENPAMISAFTLDFGVELGGVASGLIARTDYELEVDADFASARFTSYRQEVEPIILPGGFSTGNLLIEIVPDSSFGTYDELTGLFVTEEFYSISFDGNLIAFGLESPVILPSSSTGILTLNPTGESEINLNWIGEGALINPFNPQELIFFDYTCSVNTLFSVDAPMFVRLSMIPQVISLELHRGLATSLLTKLDRTFIKLEADNTMAAVGSLRAFMRAVNAQAGRRISAEDADNLLFAAEDTLSLIGTIGMRNSISVVNPNIVTSIKLPRGR